MELNLEKLSNLLDKRPMSVLLALCISFTAWSVWNWRDEVKDHKSDLRKANEAFERVTEIQYRMIELQQNKNEQQWKRDTTK